MSLSGWGFGLAGLGVLVILVWAYFSYHFWHYIFVYRSSKWVYILLTPGLAFGEYFIWLGVYNDANGIFPLLWPQLPVVLLIASYSALAVFLLGIAVLFRHSWVHRLKYRNQTTWGPFLTFADSNATAVYIAWKSKDILNRSGKLLHERLIVSKNSSAIISNETPISITHSRAISHLTRVSIGSLDPQTKILYEIPDFYPNKQFNFNSPPLPGSRAHFRFIIVGDLHAGGNPVEWLPPLLSKYSDSASFLLILGDIVSDAEGLAHWNAFFGQMQEVLPSLPMVCLPGNHDGYAPRRCRTWRGIIRQPYVEDSFAGYWALSYGNLKMIFLDYYNGGRNWLSLGDIQIHWLDVELARAQQDPNIDQIILCIHHPPYSAGEAGCDPNLGSFIDRRVTQYSKIKVVLSGHVHMYQSFLVPYGERRVPYLISGGGGGVLEEGVFRRMSLRPYYWRATSNDGSPEFLPREWVNFLYGALRNDEFLRVKHHKSLVIHHVIIAEVEGKSLRFRVINEKNESVDEIFLPA